MILSPVTVIAVTDLFIDISLGGPAASLQDGEGALIVTADGFAGIFSGNSREKSRLSGAINSGLVAGDTIGVHVCGDDVTFSKNGAPIPGKLRRVGPVYFGVQLCMPGDKVTLVRLSHAADG